jgi:hypothetical protein
LASFLLLIGVSIGLSTVVGNDNGHPDENRKLIMFLFQSK